MSGTTVELPTHVVFRELPFCGVLLDTRSSRVYRLTQQASTVLRRALDGACPAGAYEPWVRVDAPAPTAAPALRLLAALAAEGLVRMPANRQREARDGSARVEELGDGR